MKKAKGYADRGLLHQSDIEAFEAWLLGRGYEKLKTKGDYEVLRMKHPEKRGVLIVYRKLDARVHFTVQGKDVRMVRQFIREKKEGAV